MGDNCYFGLDCKIFGSVRIGDNVTVGANAVVTKDIPDGAIVGGVPVMLWMDMGAYLSDIAATESIGS